MKVYLHVYGERDVDRTVSYAVYRGLTASGTDVILSDPILNDKAGSKTLFSKKDALQACDIVVTVGGDGTILHMAAEAAPVHKPILGVNTGHLGYLTRVNPSDMSWIEDLISNKWHLEKRMMIDVKVYREDDVVFHANGLNDAVVSRSAKEGMVNLSISCDGNTVNDYYADGMIFSTPTGSTAYSLSCGGPVIDPEIEAICATPICAHSLAARPVLFKPSSVLTVTTSAAVLCVDGSTSFELEAKDKLYIKKSTLITELITFDNRSFYSVLSEKLK